MYQELKRTYTAIVLLIKLLFSDVPVAVVVFLNSLKYCFGPFMPAHFNKAFYISKSKDGNLKM